MKTIIGIILVIQILVTGCRGLFKDDELLLPKTPYLGNELRIDGYYYMCSETGGTIVKFLYRNGIILSAYHISTTNLNEVEAEMVKEYEYIKNDKSRWGVFVINDKSIQYSAWSTSVGGGLPTFKSIGVIENDTTFSITKTINNHKGQEFEKNDVYRFRQFSPKPDSTNHFIK